MTEYYENGPEGMPRVERMTRSTIMAVLSQKDVPTIYVSREEDYNSLCKFAHAVAEETLARVPAWPAERTTAPASLTDDDLTQEFSLDAIIKGIRYADHGRHEGWQAELKEYIRIECNRAILAAAPAPIQKEQSEWRIVPVEPTRDMWTAANKADDAAYAGGSQHGADIATLWEAMLDAAPVRPTQQATTIPNENNDLSNKNESEEAASVPPDLAGSQVQAADDARDAARYRWLRERRDIPHGSRNIPWVVALDPEEKIHTMILRAGIDLDHAIDAAMREQP